MRADPRELAAVFAGGALGALARALLEDWRIANALWQFT